MKTLPFTQRFIRICKKSILPLLSILLLVLVLKQLHLFERLVDIYKSCLPIFMGGVIAFLLQPIIDRLRKHFSTRTSVCLVYIGILLMGCVFLMIIMPLLYQQILDFIKVFPSWVQKIEEFLQTYHISYDNLNVVKEKYLDEGYIIVIDSLKNTMDVVTKYGIAYITAFFLSIDLDFWKRCAKKLLPNVQRFSTFYLTMSNIVFQYLVGTLIDLLFIACSVGAVLYLIDFPNAILYAIILALLNLFPYIGATFGLLLIAVVGLLSYDSFPVIPFLIVWTIQQIESNVIQPMIFNRTMNVRPILTFVFIFISEAFFGVVGVILSPIFAAIAQIAFRSYLHSKTSDKVGEWDDIWRDFDEVMREESYEN
ncbi:AI-2E family transporter [Amedibacillus sp. YH-ame10]